MLMSCLQQWAAVIPVLQAAVRHESAPAACKQLRRYTGSQRAAMSGSIAEP